jgi:formylglycine-generating enzyme required for sulfatase activity
MLGDKKNIFCMGKFKHAIACVLLISFGLSVAYSQVILVRSKLSSSKTTGGKSKSKSKSKANTAPTPMANPTPVSTLTSSLEPIPPSLAFVVKPPEFQTESNLTLGLPIVSALPVPLSKLLTYEFEVINADDRGRVVGRRAERARYFNEVLSVGVQIEMVEIPGGAFMMGSVESEIEELKTEYVRGIEREIKEALLRRLQWEAPQHMVKIPAFSMTKYEITQAQWRAVASLPKVRRELVSDPSQFKGSNRPVEKISWEEAVEFCERLSRATGHRYRLPTEAEWEYACRAGTNTPFNFGDSIKTEWANYHGKHTYATSPKGPFREQTLPVGSLGVPNAFGLYDMHGNVWEWCSDTWHDNYAAAPADGKAWVNSGIPYLKILRGGSWDSSAGECRSNSRNRMTSTIQLNNIGFRVVVEGPARQIVNEVVNEMRLTLK